METVNAYVQQPSYGEIPKADVMVFFLLRVLSVNKVR